MIMEDITENILLRLPPKSVIRCKCLSKEWNNFISNNSNFRKVYYSRLTSCSAPPRMLGFFVQQTYPLLYHDDSYQVGFVPTCSSGKRLKAGDLKFGAQSPPSTPFDPSLGFLDKQDIFLVDSSNGFLLCCLDYGYPMRYYICNPVTKERVALPETRSTSCEFVPTGFICHGHCKYPRLNMVDYKVVRGIWPYPRGDFNHSLTVEIFSSRTSQWEILNVNCHSPFILDIRAPCVVNEAEESHWLARTEEQQTAIVLFDQKRKSDGLHLIQVPSNISAWNQRLGQSDGLISYARHNMREIEIWVLQTKKWLLKYKVEINSHFKLYVLGFNSFNPLNIFVNIKGSVASYNLEDSTMNILAKQPRRFSTYFFYPYIWPNWPPL